MCSWAPPAPQVDRAFDDEALVVPSGGSGAQNRKRAAPVRATSVAKRQRLWMTTYTGGTRVETSWRPVQLRRVSSKRWMAALDNQLLVSSHCSGLRHFACGVGPDWGDWRRWPHLTIVLDAGSDGLSGSFALERK